MLTELERLCRKYGITASSVRGAAQPWPDEWQERPCCPWTVTLSWYGPEGKRSSKQQPLTITVSSFQGTAHEGEPTPADVLSSLLADADVADYPDFESWAADEEWSELFVRIRFTGLRREDLSPRERAVAGIRFQALLHYLAAIYEDVELGILPPSAFEIIGRGPFDSPYMRDTWPLLRKDHSQEFVEFVEDRHGLRETTDSVERVPVGQGAPPSFPEETT